MNKLGRIEEDIKYYLSKILTEKVKNPNIDGMISITKVGVTKDLKYAKVFLSIFGAKDSNNVLKEIEKSKGYIKRELSLVLKARNIPELVFEKDNSMEYGSRMNEIIENLNITKETEE
ncbi:MAG: 30S ribosome-binding factor RbfA [Clostridia bacterium]|nr:30S ribosome-binding factor RbfA [Clostridia bacterium]MDD4376286.1 30S ribosome-binding factor RbfA [Clostridia bacterium]